MFIGDFSVVQRLDIWVRPLGQDQLLVPLGPPLRSKVSVFVLHNVVSVTFHFRMPDNEMPYQSEVGRVFPDVPVQGLASIPIQIPQPPAQLRIIISDHFQIAHEDIDVGDVESDQSRIESDVRLGDILAE